MTNDPRDVEIARRVYSHTRSIDWGQATTTIERLIEAARLAREAAEAKPKEQTMTEDDNQNRAFVLKRSGSVYVRSNSACQTAWTRDPNGHCPMCHSGDGGGWSTLEHELWTPPEPVDPDLVAVRGILAARYRGHRDEILNGEWDYRPMGEALLAAYKAGREKERGHG